MLESENECRCIHHWVIEPANGPTSLGECKKCGLRAEFFNDLNVGLNKVKKSTMDDNRMKDRQLENEDSITPASLKDNFDEEGALEEASFIYN